jgi:hypothetical protein
MNSDLPEIRAVLQSKIKPKEKMAELSRMFHDDPRLMVELAADFAALNASEQGNCLSALTPIAAEDPKALKGIVDFVAEHVNDKPPRVKWEASQILGHLAATFPDDVAKTVPRLLKNAGDEGTVVRWSTAFAIGEIALHIPATRARLTPFITEQTKKEENNGVRKIYEKALKALTKAAKG